MAAVAHTKVDLNQNVTGYNLTDSAGFQTLVTGGSNGSKHTYSLNDIVILKNDTGGNATFTFTTPVSASLAAIGATITRPTVTIATGKTYLFRLSEVLKDGNGEVVITCDVAGKLLVINSKIT